jgi:cell wall-associated NlpC family hydrolase
MSFEAAIGRIDQILSLPQQILDPAAATATPSSGGAGLSAASGSGGSSATSFADALASAQASSALTATGATGSTDLSGLTGLLGSLGSLGLTSGASALGATATQATSAADPRLQAMIQTANSLVGKPYVWGGGHSSWAPQAGYDCSGFVSAVLHAGGYLSSPQTTDTLPSVPGIEAGPGQYVTIYDRDETGQPGHVIVDLGGQFYESGGEVGPWGGGGGVEPIATPSAAYLATFNDVLHPAGL